MMHKEKQTNPTIHTPTLPPPSSPPLSSLQLEKSPSITACTNRNGASYMRDWNASQKERPRASSASISLDRMCPLSHPTPNPHSLPLQVSLSVSLALTGRVVLMTESQQWLGAAWGCLKALTSVTAFSATRWKSVMSGKTGTQTRVERPVFGKT